MENNKEMDLIDLFVKLSKLINRSFVNLTNKFLKFLKFNIKWSFLIIPFIIIGFFLAQYKVKPENNSYYAEFTLKINVNGSPAFYSLIESLDGIKEFHPDSAAKILNLNRDEISKIRKIEPGKVIDNNSNRIPDYTDFDDEFVEEDTISIRMNDYIGVRIDGKGLLQYEKIKENIILYVNQNPFMKRETEFYRLNLEKKAKDINSQILSLNENSSSSDFDENSSEIESEGNSIKLKKGKSYSKELISLMTLREDNLEKTLIYSDAVTSCSPITVKTKHDKPFYYLFLIGGMYFISIIISLLIRHKKEVIQFIKE